MNLLVTGGAGYIGSHFVREALKKGHSIVVFDNLHRGNKESIPEGIEFRKVDLCNKEELQKEIKQFSFDCVVHFAALAYVGESVENPSLYYNNNVVGSLNLISACVENKVDNFIFSSTCSLYGNPEHIPITESESIKPINPYAYTKYFIEQILADYSRAYDMKYAALRYFNAAGANPNGDIGEKHEPETHLIPIVLKNAIDDSEPFYVFGNDYNTEDGTCIRDYIHVVDLADAHLRAIDYIVDQKKSIVLNLGTGNGYSVLEIIRKAEEITGKKLNYKVIKRREGDPAILVADNKMAKEVLGWQPKFALTEIISSAWTWHKNPKF